MSKYTSLFIKSFVFIFLVVIFAEQRIPANEKTKAKEKMNFEDKDWTELLIEKIKAEELNDGKRKKWIELLMEEIKVEDSEDSKDKDWIELLMGEIKVEDSEDSKDKDWIELLKEEIREVDQARDVRNETIAKDLNDGEGEDWIALLKEEIREVDQARKLKDEKEAKEARKDQNSEKRIIEEIGTGLSDKGIYFDLLKTLYTKNQFGIRVNYLPENFFTHKDIYVDDTNVFAEYFGVGMLYKRFLLPNDSKSNFYFQANADVSTLKLSHKKDLTKEIYSYDNLKFTCSACGILTIQTDPDDLYIIPYISLGYQYKNTPNFKTNLSLGIQYIDPGSLENFTNTKYPLPIFVQSKVDEWMQNTQNKIDEYSEFQPSISLGFSYSF